MTIKSVLRNAIRIDGGTQARVELDLETVAAYKEAIEAGAEFPPVVLFFDGTDNWLADGFHRYHAFDGKASIQADVRSGTKRDALLFAVGANGKHGKPPTIADKRKAVGLVLDDAESAALPNREVAKLCSVSHTFIARIRAERAAPPPTEPVTGGSGGNVATPPKKPGKAPAPAPTPQPPAAPAPAPGPAPAPAPAADTEAEQITAEAHGDDDLAESLASAERECQELREQIAVAQADDVKGEAMKFQRLWTVANRRQQELQQVIGDREAELRKYVGWMKRIGKAVGEDDPANVAATVEMFIRNAKVGA